MAVRHSLFYAGKYDQAIAQSRKTLEVDPNDWLTYQGLGQVYERTKQYPEAIAALQKSRELETSNPSTLGYLGHVYGVAGKKADAEKTLQELKEISKQRYVPPYNFACVYAGLGDKDQAFEWLERAYTERDFYLTLLKVEPAMDNLRSEPRFAGLLKRVGLAE